MAGPLALPYRVTFLAPILTLPQGAEHLETSSALMLFLTIFEHLVRHPRVSVTDPDDHRLVDGDERLITIHHPNIDAVKNDQFGESRRDELLWLELSLDASRPAPVKLKAERYDGHAREFVAIGQGPIGSQIENCIGQWLAATELAPSSTRIEPFAPDDLLHAAHAGYEAIRSRAPDGGVNFRVPPRLQVPFFRFVYVSCNLYTWEEILRLEPDNPWAARDKFLAQLHQDPPVRDITLIKNALKIAPMFGKLYLSMFGDGVSDEEKLNAFAMASVLIPGNPFSLKDYGYCLDYWGRWPEALRYAERACRAMPVFLPAHLLAFDVYDLCRQGASVERASHHIGFLDHLVERGAIDADDPELRHCRLRYADTLMRAGRFDEAIELRAATLRGLEGSWPNQMKVLEKWRTDPAMFAQLYAREGSLRGDPGRVVEGFSAAAPESSSEVAMLIDALIALGREDQAAMVFAQHRRTNMVENPVARLAGAKALALTGDTAGAIECIYKVSLSYGHTEWDTAINRLLRLIGTRPITEWDAVIGTHLAAGGLRLAKLIARDAADFVPAAASSQAVIHALSGATPYGHDDSLFAALRASLNPFGLGDLDAFFGHWTQPTLEHADQLAADFTALIPSMPEGDAPDSEMQKRAAKILWGFAAALGRYLAMTTQPPNVLAGGYRQVASDALEMLKTVQGVLPRYVIRQFLEGIERVASAIDPWILDTWMLRFERALDLEANEGGHLEPIVSGLPWMTWLLRGDERVGLEYKIGIEALADPSRAAEAYTLLERSVRALGRSAAPKWSTAAAAHLPPPQALDVHLTATFTHTGFAGPSLEAAKLLMPQNRGRAAFEGLCSNLPGAGKQFREKQVAALAPLWATAKMPCPHDWNQAAAAGLDALQKGNFAYAIDCHRWCLANDPNNAQLWKNLGIAYARMGDAHGALGAFARVDRIEAPKYAGQALSEAKHGAKSVDVYRYASMYFTSPDEWLAFANAATEADDSEASAEAYGRAIAMHPNAATMNVLHQLADSYNETGQYEKGAETAQRLLQAAQNDATYATCGAYHLGHALLGMGRYQEAGPYLERALAQNKYPENRQPYSEKLEHARRGQPLTPKPLRASSPTARLWTTLENSDFKAILSMAEATPDPKPWELCRAMTTSAEFRYESENTVAVTARAREQATRMLAATHGRTEIHAALVRLQALRIRENDLFPVDTPCVLGTRVPREQFSRLMLQRRGGGRASVAQGPADANDVVVFPGQRVGRLSDYVRMMKAMNSGGVNAALQAFGLDMASYSQVAMAWGQRISADPDLALRFSRMMKA